MGTPVSKPKPSVNSQPGQSSHLNARVTAFLHNEQTIRIHSYIDAYYAPFKNPNMSRKEREIIDLALAIKPDYEELCREFVARDMVELKVVAKVGQMAECHLRWVREAVERADAKENDGGRSWGSFRL